MNFQHIDHIKPLASFDLTRPEQCRRATHWSNFQPLSAADNIGPRSKGSDPPVDFAWNSEFGRWMWSRDSEWENYGLPSANVGDVIIDQVLGEFGEDEFDEFDKYGDEEEGGGMN